MRQKAHAGGSIGATAARTRAIWTRVRVITEDTSYVGRLRLPASRPTLCETLSDGMAYVTLSDVTSPGSGAVEECVAIHKGSIRSVVALDDGDWDRGRR
jgi:hypothetical protein